MSDTAIKAGTYCPVCRGMVLADCVHSADEFRVREVAVQPPMTKPNAEAGLVERPSVQAMLEQIAQDMDDAVAGGMAWISHSECYDFTARLRRIAKALPALLSQARAEMREEAAKVVQKHINRARAAIADCGEWSPAQAEWSRARDLGLDIADDLESLSATRKGGEG